MSWATFTRSTVSSRLSTLGRAFESTVAGSASSGVGNAPKEVAYPYFVRRTRFQSLPVYTDIRNGGTRKLTLIRRIDGNVEALRSDISEALEEKSVQIKSVSKTIVIKGDRINEVRAWLTKKGF